MSSKWDKMDKIVWNKSEVMQQFEKNMLNTLHKISNNLDQKIAQNLSKIPEDLSKVNQQAGMAATNLNNIANAIKKIYTSSADDKDLNKESLTTIKDVIENLKELAQFYLEHEETESFNKVKNLIEYLKSESKENKDEFKKDNVKEEEKNLIKELTALSYSLADQGETVLAYKIERVIREIKE